MNHNYASQIRRKLYSFAKVEKYACELYSKRSQYADSESIFKCVKRKFPSNKYVLEATEAAAESWNYHDETGPWFSELKRKIGPFFMDELSYARKRVKED